MLAVLVLLFSSLEAMAARADVRVGEAVRVVHDAARSLERKVDALPRKTQLQIGTDVHFSTRATDRVLQHLSRHPIAAASAGLEEDLLFLRDLLVAAGQELDRHGGAGGRQSEHRLRQLVGVAEERVESIQGTFEERLAELDGAVVSAEHTPDGLVLHKVDRTLYEGVRLAGLGLALIGLLVVGLRLLSLSEAELSVVELVKQAPLAALAGMLAVGFFLSSSVAIALDPSPVIAFVQRSELRPAPAACERLAVQREQLLDVRELGHEGLGDTVRDRMRPVVQDCLGLESQVAAVEAVEWLSASARLDPLGGARRLRAARFGTERRIDAGIEQLQSTVQRATSPAGNLDVADPQPGQGGPTLDLAEGPDQTAGGVKETSTRVNYRSGPSTEARRLGILPAGTEVVLLGQSDGWSNVRLDDGSTVYVASDFLREAR